MIFKYNLQSCDYILDKKDRFWIVHGCDNLKNKIYANLVFVPDIHGKRYNKITQKNYSKVILDNFEVSRMNYSIIKRVFKPNVFFRQNYSNLPTTWKRIARALINIGIPNDKIGIFGSYLIGFDVIKDVDFLVYGMENYYRVKNSIGVIKAFVDAKSISPEHVDYQYNKYGHFMSNKTSFKKILANNWAGLQIGSGVLSTLRFVYNFDELPKDSNLKGGRLKTFEGQVIEDTGTNFIPRIGFIKSKGKIIRVFSYFWMLNSFLKKGMHVRIRAEYNLRDNTLYIKNKKHWIKILT